MGDNGVEVPDFLGMSTCSVLTKWGYNYLLMTPTLTEVFL